MSISAVGDRPSPQSQLLSSLQSNGLSADKASQISSEIDSVIKSATSSSGGSRPDPADVRSAIEAKLKEDVTSGEISEEEASTILASLDQFEQQMKANGPPPGSPPPGESGEASSDGEEDSSSKEVESTKSSTVNGVTTTVTTYTDGTTSTKVTYDDTNTSTADALQELLKALSGSSTSSDYLTKLLSSGLVDTKA